MRHQGAHPERERARRTRGDSFSECLPGALARRRPRRGAGAQRHRGVRAAAPRRVTAPLSELSGRKSGSIRSLLEVRLRNSRSRKLSAGAGSEPSSRLFGRPPTAMRTSSSRQPFVAGPDRHPRLRALARRRFACRPKLQLPCLRQAVAGSTDCSFQERTDARSSRHGLRAPFQCGVGVNALKCRVRSAVCPSATRNGCVRNWHADC